MILIYLILAHLLGDFVLQTSKLVEMKEKGYGGLIIHSSVHSILLFLLPLPVYYTHITFLFFVSVFIGFLHFMIDHTKIIFQKKHNSEHSKAFVVDQFIHLFTLFLAFFLLSKNSAIIPNTTFYKIYTDVSLIVFFILLIFLYKVVEVYKFQRKSNKSKKAKFIMNREQANKRVTALTLFYLLYILITLLTTRS